MSNKSTAEKATDFVEASRAQTKKDGDIIALLYKGATEQQNQIQTKDQKIEQLNQELQKFAGEGEYQSSQQPELNQENLKDLVTKMAEDGITDQSLIDTHVESAQKDPNHLVQMMQIQERAIREKKQASEDSLGRVGKLGESSGKDASSSGSFNRVTREQTAKQYEELDKHCGLMISGRQ